MAGAVPRWFTLSISDAPTGTCTIVWGDGTADTSLPIAGPGTVTNNHEYTTANVPTGTSVTITVTDANGKVATTTQKIMDTNYPDFTLVPTSVTVGSPDTTVELTVPTAGTYTGIETVMMDGAPLATTMTDDQTLSVVVPASRLASEAYPPVWVSGTDGRLSMSQTLSVLPAGTERDTKRDTKRRGRGHKVI